MSTPAPFRYRTDIDGLRAVAVVPVVLFHAGFTVFSGGFVGVDIFFVISGFLITSLIYREILAGEYSLVQFYERRIRRIFPALLVMLAATLPLALWMLLPEDFESYSKSVASTGLSISNMFFWSESGYFDAPAQLKPLLHTWSLAVEEQFYVVFPIALWLFSKFLPRRAILILFLLAAAGSLALSAWGVANKPEATFYLLPTRAWELLFGAVIALGLPTLKNRSVNDLMALAGLALVAFSIFNYTHQTPFPGLAAVIPCLGAALIIYAGQVQATWVGKLLSLAPVVYVGRISYSLYLWHWPLLVFAGYYMIRPLTLWESSSLVALAVVLAALSLKYVEAPFRGRKAWGTQRQVYGVALVAILLSCCVGAVGVKTHGLPQRMNADVTKVLQADNRDPKSAVCHQAYALKIDPLCKRGDEGQPVSFLIIGDSHAGALAPAVFEAAKLEGKAGLQLSDSGYVAVPGYIKRGEPDKYAYMNRLLEKTLAANPQIKTIVIVNYWQQSLFNNTYTAPNGQVADGKTAVVDALTTLAKAHPQVTFWILGDNPHSALFGVNALARSKHFGFGRQGAILLRDAEIYQQTYDSVLEPLMKIGNVRRLEITPALCSGAICPALTASGEPVYRDTNHLSYTGAIMTVPLLRAVFKY